MTIAIDTILWLLPFGLAAWAIIAGGSIRSPEEQKLEDEEQWRIVNEQHHSR